MNPKTDPEYDGLALYSEIGATQAQGMSDEATELMFDVWLAQVKDGPWAVPGFGWVK